MQLPLESWECRLFVAPMIVRKSLVSNPVSGVIRNWCCLQNNLAYPPLEKDPRIGWDLRDLHLIQFLADLALSNEVSVSLARLESLEI